MNGQRLTSAAAAELDGGHEHFSITHDFEEEPEALARQNESTCFMPCVDADGGAEIKDMFKRRVGRRFREEEAVDAEDRLRVPSCRFDELVRDRSGEHEDATSPSAFRFELTLPIDHRTRRPTFPAKPLRPTRRTYT